MRKRIVRFEIQDMLPIGLTLVVAGIGIVYGMSVMADVKSGIIADNPSAGIGGCTGSESSNCTDSWDINASTNAIKGVAKIPEKMPLIATVIVAAIIIGILVRYLMVRFT